ncbi:hypothetical protein MKW92_033376 [Papaver armeniacum]|nr:hypothetical protein MKW92_033376 [Papaver armeniacum]
MGTEDWSSDSDVEETLTDDLRSACNCCGEKKKYTVLKEEDIRKRQEEDITEISTVLYIPRASATILLRYFDWNVTGAQEAWFANEEKVRKDVGLLENQLSTIENNIIECPICSHEFPRDGVCAAACGHLFCKLCWTRYVSKNISDGPGCLKMQCPETSCAVAVGQDMINELVSDEDKEKYSRYLLRSYVDDQRNIKWCPGAGCEYAVGFIGESSYLISDSSSYDVVCNNGHSFCWNCLDDAHRPVDCNTAGKWAVQISNEPENLTWICANSKPCPECKRAIEKNQGGMRMTCRCGFEFCWLCLSDWPTHWEITGNYYSCNAYEKARAEGVYDEEEKTRKEAKDYLDKYARFVENQKSRLEAAESLQKLKSRDLTMLSYRYYMPEDELRFITDAWQQIMECRQQGLYSEEDHSPKAFYHFRGKLLTLTSNTRTYFENLVRSLENGLSEKLKSRDLTMLSYRYYMPEDELRFITDAWQQIMECRRVLKWTYVYAYYLPTGDHVKKQFIDFHQGQAECCLERLHECAEQGLYSEEDHSPKAFYRFRGKLLTLTSNTRTYFENLVRSLENGLSEVDSR